MDVIDSGRRNDEIATILRIIEAVVPRNPRILRRGTIDDDMWRDEWTR